MNLRPSLLTIVALALASLTSLASTAGTQAAQARTTASAPAAPSTASHFVANLHGAVTGPRSAGFTVFDTGPSSSVIDALPDGVRAMVWLGQKCPTTADDSFRRTVRQLSNRDDVVGYYLSDEPHIADCPGGPAALASRADYIYKLNHGRQRSFIVLSRTADFKPFRTSVTHVGMVGLDPYPCSVANPGCEVSKIDERVNAALAAGIPLGRIVPVYQGFGQQNAEDHYYNLPTVTQMQAMLARWAELVPNPRMDYTYGWGHQTSANPTLVDSPGLQRLFASAFGG